MIKLVKNIEHDWELKCLAASGQVRVETENYLIFIGGQGKAMYFEHKRNGRACYGKATFWHDTHAMKSYYSATGHDLPQEVIDALGDMDIKVKGFRYHIKS